MPVSRLPDEAVAAGSASRRRDTRRAAALSRRTRLGATEGNEILTSVTALLLVALLIAEGLTILRIGSLITPHMFTGMALIPPVLLKLGSTGWRFARYYTGAHAYVEKGPPLLPLRLLAPILVVATIVVLATGVWLMLLGHRSGTVLLLHKASFIVWGAVFAIHFLAYLPRMVRSLRADWTASRRHEIPGAGVRGMLVAASLGGGLALAVAVLSLITAWHGGHHHHD